MHAPLHAVRPVAQPMVEQTPAEHTEPAAHASAHAPQLAGSLATFTHAAPHAMVPIGHTHAPALQVWSARQAVAQVPQCVRSLWTSTHAPVHEVKPVEQPVIVQTPLEHTCPVTQTLPQLPQFIGSLCVVTHVAPQRVSPAFGHSAVIASPSGTDASGMDTSSVVFASSLPSDNVSTATSLRTSGPVSGFAVLPQCAATTSVSADKISERRRRFRFMQDSCLVNVECQARAPCDPTSQSAPSKLRAARPVPQAARAATHCARLEQPGCASREHRAVREDRAAARGSSAASRTPRATRVA